VKRGKSILRIYSTTKEYYFFIHIDDNGAGIEEGKLKSLNEELSQITSVDQIDESISISKSIGLINVNKRIKLKYGDDYGLSINSSEATGTQVIIKLPLMNDSI
jgi:two-component system sensor histidine kinase YesM